MYASIHDLSSILEALLASSSCIRLDGEDCAQLFSDLSKDIRWSLSLGSGWATQRHSESGPEATAFLSWISA